MWEIYLLTLWSKKMDNDYLFANMYASYASLVKNHAYNKAVKATSAHKFESHIIYEMTFF